ncbi:MAG: plasma-membrane proton-efflux P-type ATPase [Pseudomonas helleri]|jgi:H+-transporting ATPase|nr:hypothetical protein [Pseudomonas helleri]
MLFLQLAAGGHLLLFVVRNRNSVFKPPFPSLPLLLAVIGTQIVAVFICAFGIFVPAISWELIGVVWVYVLVWMVIIDIVKLIYFSVVDKREKQSENLTKAIA